MQGRPEVFPSLRAEPAASHPGPSDRPEALPFSLSLPAEPAASRPGPSDRPAVLPFSPAQTVEPAAVSVAVLPVADVAELRVAVDIAPAFDASFPASGAAVEVDSPGHPRFFAFPNVDRYASPSSFAEVAGGESFHSSTGVRTNYVPCSIPSNPGLHQNRNLERCYSKPNPGYNNAIGTSGLPRDATTTRPRKTCLRRHQEQRTHTYQVSRSPPAAPRKRWAAAGGYQY